MQQYEYHHAAAPRGVAQLLPLNAVRANRLLHLHGLLPAVDAVVVSNSWHLFLPYEVPEGLMHQR